MSAATTRRLDAGVFSSTRAQLAQRALRTDKLWLSAVLTNLGLATFLPSHHWRSAQALLQTSHPVLDVDAGQQAELPSHAVHGSRSAP
jgi:hypothetical protein